MREKGTSDNARINSKIDFDALFRTYYEPLYYFALQYVTDEDDCRDIVTGVFEQLWRNLSDVHPDTVRALLYTHVRNRCIDLLRHEKQKLQYADFVARQSQHYIEAQEYNQQEERERIVAQVLDSMGEPTHSILLACYVDGKKYKEVAEMMNISISTVKKHIVKALRIIREKRAERQVTIQQGEILLHYDMIAVKSHVEPKRWSFQTAEILEWPSALIEGRGYSISAKGL